ncbi:reverse transcriptase domain-containing protein [Tanacetum coccineum]
MLTAPRENEELIMYLAAAKEAISAVLMTERGGKQIPVYFAKDIDQRTNIGRFYRRTTGGRIPGRINGRPEELPEPWTLFTDRSSCIDSSGAGLILTNLEGVEFTYAMRFKFEATNNEAEYEGIDIAGPFPEGPGKVKLLIVAIDYFTKWIEAKPVATIMGNQVKKFVWDNIVCRFGLPGEICFASVKYPQANGLVERANRSLGEGIKARLDERSKDWIGEILYVLWAHRTIKSSNGETRFSLTYGTEAVIPAEIDMQTLRTAELDLTKNDEALKINLDLIEEKREQATIQEAKVKLRWKSTTTLKSEAQASGRGTWSTVAMMQATPRTKENLALNRKDHMKLRTR